MHKQMNDLDTWPQADREWLCYQTNRQKKTRSVIEIQERCRKGERKRRRRRRKKKKKKKKKERKKKGEAEERCDLRDVSRSATQPSAVPKPGPVLGPASILRQIYKARRRSFSTPELAPHRRRA